MGKFIGRCSNNFGEDKSGYYVDKTGLIHYINSTLNSKSRFTCISRPRRFGKTMALDMLDAYYNKAMDSKSLFTGMEIERLDPQLTNLNKFPVISFSAADFLTDATKDNYSQKLHELVSTIHDSLLSDISEEYSDYGIPVGGSLINYLVDVVSKTGEKFIMLIDEWDSILREVEDTAVQKSYIDFLRSLFKSKFSKTVFAGVYITGILPIVKIDNDSAMNDFWEYTVVNPMGLERYFGFTIEEVESLCSHSGFNLSELKDWYDGYMVGRLTSVFSPNSVIRALTSGYCRSYWTTSRSYESIKVYISMNFDGLKDSILELLAGGRCYVNVDKFSNNLKNIGSRDDVLTILIHLGYLSYDYTDSKAFVPNKEVEIELRNAVEASNYGRIAVAVSRSEKLLEYTLALDEQHVAEGLEQVHDEEVPILSYNNEESLAYSIRLAYSSSINYYKIYRECKAGKGYADLVFIPLPNVKKSAIIIELKYDKSVESAIKQIKEKKYPSGLIDYTGEVILVGINYDRKTKKHSCIIEKFIK